MIAYVSNRFINMTHQISNKLSELQHAVLHLEIFLIMPIYI